MIDVRPRSWFHPSLSVAPSRVHGRGVVVGQAVPAGSLLVEWGGTAWTRADLEAGRLPPGSSYSFIDEDLLLAGTDEDLDHFVNHSCVPTAWMDGPLRVVARRDLGPGEEVTGDYALWEGEDGYSLSPCRCGAAECRGRVSGGDWRLPDLQQRYAGHFLPYLQRRIDRLGLEQQGGSTSR